MTFRSRFSLLVAFQVLLVLSLVAYKQLTVWTGQTLWLRTSPVDPRDLMRGEYVALNLDIARLDPGVLWQSGPSATEGFRRGDTVYVTLRRDGAYYTAASASPDLPDAPVFLRGTVTDVQHDTRDPKGFAHSVWVRYGIESWFVPRGEGPTLEREAAKPGNMLAVQVVVDRAGVAVLRQVRVERRDRQR